MAITKKSFVKTTLRVSRRVRRVPAQERRVLSDGVAPAAREEETHRVPRARAGRAGASRARRRGCARAQRHLTESIGNESMRARDEIVARANGRIVAPDLCAGRVAANTAIVHSTAARTAAQGPSTALL